MRSLAILLFAAQALAANTYNLTLPWGIWQSTFDSDNNIYKFDNVRFGASTAGSNRFQPAQYPSERNQDIQTGSNASCPQIDPSLKACSPGGNNQVSPPADSFYQNEDCLFLDIYVPAPVLENAKNQQAAPVAVWIFGGAFVFGSKDSMMYDGFNTPFYDGTGVVDHTKSTIFVAGNYRLGAFGWLAGVTMEKDGYPNAGLSDQRLVFDFVTKYINQVGGDKSKVSAWGESAGASSILHHLVSRKGSQQLVPQFQRAALQSPAYQWISDRTGYMEQTFINYTCLVCWYNTDKQCCPTDKIQPKALYTVKQLQSFPSKNLTTANQWLFSSTQRCNGLFPVGPSVDAGPNSVIQNLADVEFASGRFAVLDSIILSHVHDEAATFINPPTAATDAEYRALLTTLFRGFPNAVNQIAAQYPAEKYSNNQTLRLKATIQDMVFLSNNRIMFDAYSATKRTKVYTMSWNFLTLPTGDYSYHATDLLALFFRPNWKFVDYVKAAFPNIKVTDFQLNLLAAALKDKISPIYQTYWTQHSLNGDPNGGPGPAWSIAAGTGSGVDNTMTVQFNLLKPFESKSDPLLPEEIATFWTGIAKQIDPLKSAPVDSYETGDGSQAPLFAEDL